LERARTTEPRPREPVLLVKAIPSKLVLPPLPGEESVQPVKDAPFPLSILKKAFSFWKQPAAASVEPAPPSPIKRKLSFSALYVKTPSPTPSPPPKRRRRRHRYPSPYASWPPPNFGVQSAPPPPRRTSVASGPPPSSSAEPAPPPPRMTSVASGPSQSSDVGPAPPPPKDKKEKKKEKRRSPSPSPSPSRSPSPDEPAPPPDEPAPIRRMIPERPKPRKMNMGEYKAAKEEVHYFAPMLYPSF